MNIVMTRAAVIVGIVLTASLVACGVGSTPRSGKLVPQPSSTPTAPPTQNVTPMGQGAVKVTGPASTDSGAPTITLAVATSAPKKFTPTEGAAGAVPGGTAIKFDMTVVNDSTVPYDSNGVIIEVTIGGVSTSTVYDSNQNIGKQFGDIIPPGRPLTITLAFSASTQDTGVIDVVVKPLGWSDPSQIAIFRGAI